MACWMSSKLGTITCGRRNRSLVLWAHVIRPSASHRPLCPPPAPPPPPEWGKPQLPQEKAAFRRWVWGQCRLHADFLDSCRQEGQAQDLSSFPREGGWMQPKIVDYVLGVHEAKPLKKLSCQESDLSLWTVPIKRRRCPPGGHHGDVSRWATACPPGLTLTLTACACQSSRSRDAGGGGRDGPWESTRVPWCSGRRLSLSFFLFCHPQWVASRSCVWGGLI